MLPIRKEKFVLRQALADQRASNCSRSSSRSTTPPALRGRQRCWIPAGNTKRLNAASQREDVQANCVRRATKARLEIPIPAIYLTTSNGRSAPSWSTTTTSVIMRASKT